MVFNISSPSTSIASLIQWLPPGLIRFAHSVAATRPIDKASYDEHIEKMANDAVTASSTGNNPVIPTLDQIKDIYDKVYYD
jgi:alcohol dehydrogenase class IV